MLTVRSRVRSDLDGLKEFLPTLGTIEENTGTDYRFRANAKRNEVAKALGADLTLGIFSEACFCLAVLARSGSLLRHFPQNFSPRIIDKK